MATRSASPIEAAANKFGARTPIGSILRTEGWRRMPAELRDRAFFSAGVRNVELLQAMQKDIQQALAVARDSSGGFVDRSVFIGAVRERVAALRAESGGLRSDLGDLPESRIGDPRSLLDVASRRRAGLIYDMAIQSAHGYARWQTDNSPEVLDAFPGQELLPSSARQPRETWERRWIELGGQVIEGRIVGLKTDPRWILLNRFRVPWAPFDFGSTRVLMDLDRDECEALGLIRPGERLLPAAADFNDRLAASVANLSPRFLESLKTLFGDQVDVEGDSVRWKGSRP